MQPSYRYRAELDRVVDGDTLDVVIDLGFYIKIKERIRLEGVDTPEIYGVPQDSEEYRRGLEAKEYVERRLNENGNQMIIETRKMGKWRRWLAKVYLPDTGRTLNEELIEKGLARRVEEHAGGR
ncbi:MAG: thermonuclease family protein [Candidatus Verstraetearchaeota archaeon]|nr:thermonuclease family protein [Candidatus Verstraetearchaeota archaeon]